MIEPARIQAAIEILELVADSLGNDGPSADVLIRKYFRSRRYAGSKDRRAVTDRVYQVIRNWGFLCDTAEGDVRRMLLLSLSVSRDRDEINALFSGLDHAPDKLSDGEKKFLSESHAQQPHHKLNYPLWLEAALKDRFGDDFDGELAALNDRAAFELRVNLAKATVTEVEQALSAQQVEFVKGKWVDTAIILSGNPRIHDWDIYKNGLVEIQDEAAQLAVMLCDIKPGQQVMDLCAGAGGKTLAAAAYMENKGQIYAFDNDARRLKDLKPRARRADARIIQTHHLDTAGGKREKDLSEYKYKGGGTSHARGGAQVAQGAIAPPSGKMDRVILDVPCSGSGVWRRNPELKWRLTEEKLAQYCKIQKNLLTEGWGFVKTGGRMIYMTCSLLPRENEQQVTEFLAEHEDAGLVSYREIYVRDNDAQELKTLSPLPQCLALSPYSHGTDGFFVAILEKTP